MHTMSFIARYHLKDVIVGKIYFLLVRIKIKNMELSIVRRETTGAAPNQYNENETITKFEIMDGAPVRGNRKLLLLVLSISIYSSLIFPRRNHSNSSLFEWLRFDTHISRHQQKILNAVLSESGSY